MKWTRARSVWSSAQSLLPCQVPASLGGKTAPLGASKSGGRRCVCDQRGRVANEGPVFRREVPSPAATGLQLRSYSDKEETQWQGHRTADSQMSRKGMTALFISFFRGRCEFPRETNKAQELTVKTSVRSLFSCCSLVTGDLLPEMRPGSTVTAFCQPGPHPSPPFPCSQVQQLFGDQGDAI